MSSRQVKFYSLHWLLTSSRKKKKKKKICFVTFSCILWRREYHIICVITSLLNAFVLRWRPCYHAPRSSPSRVYMRKNEIRYTQYGSLLFFSPKSTVSDTYLNIWLYILWDKVCQWLAVGRLFFPGAPVSSTNKTDCIKHHNPNHILLN
jgi:predicted small integral membrane protein